MTDRQFEMIEELLEGVSSFSIGAHVIVMGRSYDDRQPTKEEVETIAAWIGENARDLGDVEILCYRKNTLAETLEMVKLNIVDEEQDVN